MYVRRHQRAVDTSPGAQLCRQLAIKPSSACNSRNNNGLCCQRDNMPVCNTTSNGEAESAEPRLTHGGALFRRPTGHRLPNRPTDRRMIRPSPAPREDGANLFANDGEKLAVKLYHLSDTTFLEVCG